MKKYQVIYLENNMQKVFRVLAHNKQEACDLFRRVVSGSLPIIDIIDVAKKSWKHSIPALVAILLATIFFIFAVIVIDATWGRPEPTSYESYTVSSGDTLWELARMSDGWNRVDGSYIIEDIQSESDCSALIHPGQVIYIPMYN